MKSLTGSAMTVVDYLVPDYDVWSNMRIVWGLRLGDYIIGYSTKELDKAELLKLQVGSGMLFVDEVNLEFSEARRAMTNRNLTFNKLLQQLRKKTLNLIYTVQHEMWVDDRLRFQTDVFIRCQDILLKPGGLSLPYEFGTYCDWTIFDMSGYLGSGSYYDTGKPHSTKRFYGRRWWNTFDTLEVQGEDEETYGKSKQMGSPQFTKPDYIIKEQDEFGFLREMFQDLQTQGLDIVRKEELWSVLGITKLGDKQRFGNYITRDMKIKTTSSRDAYLIPQVNLDKPETIKKSILQQD